MAYSDLYRPAGVTQALTSSGSSAASSAVGDQTYAVAITATENVYVTLGAAPTATATNGMYLEQDWPHYLSIHPGEKVAVLQVSTGGTVYVSELTR